MAIAMIPIIPHVHRDAPSGASYSLLHCKFLGIFITHLEKGTHPDRFIRAFSASTYGDCRPTKTGAIYLGGWDNHSWSMVISTATMLAPAKSAISFLRRVFQCLQSAYPGQTSIYVDKHSCRGPSTQNPQNAHPGQTFKKAPMAFIVYLPATERTLKESSLLFNILRHMRSMVIDTDGTDIWGQYRGQGAIISDSELPEIIEVLLDFPLPVLNRTFHIRRNITIELFLLNIHDYLQELRRIDNVALSLRSQQPSTDTSSQPAAIASQRAPGPSRHIYFHDLLAHGHDNGRKLKLDFSQDQFWPRVIGADGDDLWDHYRYQEAMISNLPGSQIPLWWKSQAGGYRDAGHWWSNTRIME
ncbi:hypothetical protein M413DRAFT_13571 [Hebeloma cylindrosporum]|uniref:Uncharacterized protein n=1 Tax=Hebeloma cylindrosporum TaxID=76867 RepID=A0A0C2XGG1_HEBCY|nr:hypothetical protein M413DRAFT_13571 [Hebeloma cylindrosporum h7]